MPVPELRFYFFLAAVRITFGSEYTMHSIPNPIEKCDYLKFLSLSLETPAIFELPMFPEWSVYHIVLAKNMLKKIIMICTCLYQFSFLNMADREERRFAELSRESVRLLAESAGVDLGDDVTAILAEDVCYRLREATQVRARCMRY